ncbi:MAG: hypothetical protein CMM16_06645 [Rhodospirillaceae bacterium]|nr:hypothetical protein [Rhodospirillaceae bacterium]
MLKNHSFGILAFILFLTVGVWSYFGTLDYVTVTQGVVTPSNKIKKIQHLEGGIIRSILVSEGERVGQGTPLIELEATKSEAEFNELETRLVALQIDLIRLRAEQDFAETVGSGFSPRSSLQGLVFPKKMRDEYPSKVEKAIALFRIRKTSLINRISAQKNIVLQKRQDSEQIQQKLIKNKKYLKILKEKIGISDKLLKDNLSNRLDHLKYLEQKIGIEGTISEDYWSLEKSKTAIAEAKIRIQTLKDAHKETAVTEYSEKNNAYEELRFRKARLLDNRSRTMIRSPAEGRVKYLYYTTVGGVISPGAVVVEIVPDAGKLIVEGRLPVNEKAYVKVGQSVKVRLTAPGPAGFGQLDGRIEYISADSISDQNGLTYFLTRITVEGDTIAYKEKSYQLGAGESVECRILIGERRIIDYFIEPFWRGAGVALRER